jgi:transcriptional regulator with XRE-family HTH domain
MQRLLERHRVSGRQLAVQAGLYEKAVNGAHERQSVSIPTVRAVAEALDEPVTEVLDAFAEEAGLDLPDRARNIEEGQILELIRELPPDARGTAVRMLREFRNAVMHGRPRRAAN